MATENDTPEAQIDWTHLPDMRRTVANPMQQSFLLYHRFPAMYSQVGLARDFPVRDTSGLDVLVVVLRTLYAQLAQPHRGASGSSESGDFAEEIARDEERNPLLRLAWSDLADTPESHRAQSAARHAIVQALARQAGSRLPDLSFLALAESEAMQRTIWRRLPFLLYRRELLWCPADAPDADWNTHLVDPSPAWARCGLVTWDCARSLPETIAELFGSFTAPALNRQELYLFNRPAAIRVHCTVPATQGGQHAGARPAFRDIQRVRLTPEGLDPPESHEYVLIAVVRLRGDDGDRDDLVRTYAASGAVVLPTRGFYYGRIDWLFGAPGESYMLYYTLSTFRPATRAPVPELPRMPEGWEDALESMRRAAN